SPGASDTGGSATARRVLPTLERALRVGHLEQGGDGASGELMRMAVGRTGAPAIRYHRRRCMLMSARCAHLFIGMTATMSASNCRTVTCPPSSVGRAHRW